MYQSHLIIAGQEVGPEDVPGFDRLGPLSDRVVTRAVAARASDAERTASSAAAAFAGWAATRAALRHDILVRAAELMEARQDEAVEIAGQEVGASPEWIRFNVSIAVAMLRQAARLAALVGAEDVMTLESGDRLTIRRQPAGVVLGIAPWNAPVTLATRAVAAPLACGNTVVLKGSELCPKTHEWVAQVLIAAGLPPGVLNFVTNAPDHASEVVEALVAHAAVRRVNFTGSTRVGREIAMVAARHLKPCLLELSGKATAVVLADADLDLAAREIAHGAFLNQGQICMSTERVIVEEAVADAFLDRLIAQVTPLRTNGAGTGPLGAMVSPGAAVRLRGVIDDALQRGARLATGGDVFGATFQPTVLDHVAPGMRIYGEEVFGPIVGVIRAGDGDEALSLAGDTEFGLAASVFSRDEARAEAMLAQIETGIGHINRSTVFDDPAMPFGGVKASGYGRFGGIEALKEFTECQVITRPPSGAAAGPG